MLQRLTPDRDWAAGRVASLPIRWQARLIGTWSAKHPQDRRGANLELLKTTESLAAVSIPLDASDATICDAAEVLAAKCASRAEVQWLYPNAPALRAAMERIARGQGIEPPHEKVKDGPAIARLCCPLWWRRKLRRHHGRTVEAAAIRLGYVNRGRDLYCSAETLARRTAQNARNLAALENTTARNELGQEYTLAELAATGPGNKKIRRAELMTRIAGFERIARDLGHEGLFLTITCPSRFHRHRTVNDGRKVIDNPAFDPKETPATGQAYLARTWARIRAALARVGVKLYGFRIAEPQHDGTPHWHLLVFYPPGAADTVRAIVTAQALKDTPDEPGAREHRCDFKPIDWTQGTAAGYIAKYVAKNIDGYKVGEDLHGQPAMETCARVEAWATTWGIRQFQQVGGPPVGVWRELRRVESVPDSAPEFLSAAHRAVNKLAVIEGRDNASVAWDRYCQAQGGVFCGRGARIRLTMVRDEGKLGRYGDEAAPRPIGVEASTVERYEPHHGTVAIRRVLWQVESCRHRWEIVSRGRRPNGRVSIAERAQPAQPWTRVNNCTAEGREGVANEQRPDAEEAAGSENGLRELRSHDPGGHWAGGASPDRAGGGAGRGAAGGGYGEEEL